MTRLAALLVALALVAAPARATLSAGPVLTFARADRALAAATEDGTSTMRLAGPPVTTHAWSPDGRRIAFTRCRGENCSQGAVYVVDADGRNEHLLVSAALVAGWMPDGRHLLVDRADGYGHWVVAVGDGGRRAFRAPGLAAAPYSPRLSPDGRWLLHLAPIYGRLLPSPSAPHHARARNWLIVTDLRTRASHRVSNERGLYYLGSTPWSPDATRFTFTRRKYLQASGGRIYVARPSGGEPQLVAEGAREAGAWSPDGLRLAFNVGNACAIRVVAIDGSSTRLLPFKGCLPTWRP